MAVEDSARIIPTARAPRQERTRQFLEKAAKDYREVLRAAGRLQLEDVWLAAVKDALTRCETEMGLLRRELRVHREQLGRGLVTDAGKARDVVGRVALERLEVDHLAGSQPVPLLDALGVVDDRGVDAHARGHQLGPLGDELEHVEIARDDEGLQPLLGCG